MTFDESVTLETANTDDGRAFTGGLGLPTSGVWTRLLTGRLDSEHAPREVASQGTPTLEDLRSLFQGDPMSARDQPRAG